MYAASVLLACLPCSHNNVNGEPVYGNQIAVIHEMSNATYGVNDACIAGEGAGNECECAANVRSFRPP